MRKFLMIAVLALPLAAASCPEGVDASPRDQGVLGCKAYSEALSGMIVAFHRLSDDVVKRTLDINSIVGPLCESFRAPFDGSKDYTAMLETLNAWALELSGLKAEQGIE